MSAGQTVALFAAGQQQDKLKKGETIHRLPACYRPSAVDRVRPQLSMMKSFCHAIHPSVSPWNRLHPAANIQLHPQRMVVLLNLSNSSSAGRGGGQSHSNDEIGWRMRSRLTWRTYRAGTILEKKGQSLIRSISSRSLKTSTVPLDGVIKEADEWVEGQQIKSRTLNNRMSTDGGVEAVINSKTGKQFITLVTLNSISIFV